MQNDVQQEKESALSEYAKVAAEAARIGGEVLLTHLSRVQFYEVEEKGAADFATQVDHASERAIVDHIRKHYPDHEVLAEEGGSLTGNRAYRWVIDPLDGTTNYLHDVRIFAVSIALLRDNEPIVGVVNDPVRGEVFTAEQGRGAWLNGVRIAVSANADLGNCLFATGFPFRMKELVEPYLRSFQKFFGKVRDVRRMGAAAIDLAYVAAGRFDGFWELKLNPWDFAAGVLLITEAGGRVSGFSPGEDYWASGNIVASNGLVHDLIMDDLSEFFN